MINRTLKTIIICLMIAVPFSAFAHTSIMNSSDNSELIVLPAVVSEHTQLNNIPFKEFKFSCKHNSSVRNSDGEESFNAILTESGTLASLLGERIYEISSISVEGPMNDADFNTLWESSFNGKLKIIDLEHAEIEGGKIPDRALFHIDTQMNWDTWVVTTIPLEKIVFPDNVTEIGEFAVAYAISLNEVKLPNTLRKINTAAFTDCISLTAEQLVFPESLEVIDEQAFYQCIGLTGKITLPKSLKAIVCSAFYRCKISEINFPQSLEYLGCMAFAGSALKKVILPDNCSLCYQGGQFYNNWELTEAHLPDNSILVPDDVFSGCFSLKEVNIPSHAITIGQFAFDQVKMSTINFPETLKSIGQDAFQSCNELSTIVLPASLKSLGDRAFASCGSLTSIWCMATVPPVYVPAQGYESDRTPFSSVNPSTPVYIPVGTKQQYMTAPGWDYMTNFIETDDFPSASIDYVTIERKEQDNNLYDLFGRKVCAPQKGNIYIQSGKKILIK